MVSRKDVGGVNIDRAMKTHRKPVTSDLKDLPLDRGLTRQDWRRAGVATCDLAKSKADAEKLLDVLGIREELT